jgi:superfamily II DNA/RNA helicase
MSYLEYMTMPKPTLIQKAAVPAILSKHDAYAISYIFNN